MTARRDVAASAAGSCSTLVTMSLLNHPAVFDRSPVSILCEDWSRIRIEVMKKLAEGVGDFAQYLLDHPEFIYQVRQHHRIVDANPIAIRLLGVRGLADLQGRVGNLLPADIESNTRVLLAMARGDRYCEGERILRTPDGRTVPIVWRAGLPEGDEGYDQLYFFAFDMSEQKKAQEALLAARENLSHSGRLSLVGELAASMAHEIAQPISSIVTHAHATRMWLRRGVTDEAMASLTRIGASAEHAAQVVRRIKDFSRRSATEMSPHDPRELVRGAVALIEHEARRSRTPVSVELGADLPRVMADHTQIQQVLVNIVVNALQAIVGSDAVSRSVRILAVSSGDMVEFHVEDTGPGLTQEALEQIFEPFFSTKAQGTGLGLAISRRIIEDHGGRLWAASRAGGATFSFTLPAAPR